MALKGKNMTEQQPHLEILSRNRVNRSTIIVAVIPVTLFSGVFIIAIWRFLWLLAYGALVFLSISFLYFVAIMAINVRQKWLHAPYLYVEEQNGVFNTSTGRMHPLALPAPIITEVTEDEALKRSKILNLRAKGRSLREIEDELKIPYNQVQEICRKAKNLVIEK